MKPKIQSSFLKSVLVLASGSLFAQLITVSASPFLTRLFTPSEIGIYTFVLSVATMFMAVINGRFDMSIVSEEKEEHIYPLIKLSIVISVILSILITIGYIIYIIFISNEYIDYLYTAGFMIILLLSYGILNVLTAYNNRKKEYKIMTSVHIIRSFFQNFGAVIMGLFGVGLLGLLFPYTIGQLMGINRQSKSLKPYIKEVKKVTVAEMVKVFKLHYKQPMYSAPALFANSLSYSSITIIIASIFGMSAVGFYSISVRLLGLPLALVSGNVSKVFFEAASREYIETNQFYKSLKKTIIFQTIIAIPMVMLMMFFAPRVFGFVFGEGWEIAGQYVVILAPMFGVRFIVTTISPGLIIANKQNLELIVQLGFIVASAVCFVFTKVANLSIEYYLLWVSLLFSIVYIVFLFLVIKCSKEKDMFS